MKDSLRGIIESYNPHLPLAEAFAPPAPWYTDPGIFGLEREVVFRRSWQTIGTADRVSKPGQYMTSEIAGAPILFVRGADRVLRGFYNVCRHKGAAIITALEGQTEILRCPYHGWTYSLDGTLKGTPDFAGVKNFDAAGNGLIQLQSGSWEKWILARLDADARSLDDFLGPNLKKQMKDLRLENFQWLERRRYTLDCNWKVFVDNYLDGGYHVPHLHLGLDSVLDYRQYTIECGERFCLQSSPIANDRSDPDTAAVRKGKRALYFWIYPNFMINCYEGFMDTHLVIPRGVDRTEVIFDFYFADISDQAREKNHASIAVSEQIQNEDTGICNSVQRGLASGAYTRGRLSFRREGGEHLFHRLLYADLISGAGIMFSQSFR
jgi:choline monooxygenase